MDSVVVVLQFLLFSEALNSLALSLFGVNVILKTASKTVLAVLSISRDQVQEGLILSECVMQRLERLSDDFFVESHRSDRLRGKDSIGG